MKENKKIIEVLIAICSLFFILVGYLTYIQVFKSKEIVQNTYNRRQYQADENTTRGQIIDRKGIVLAFSEERDNTQQRIYPYSSLYSHVIGYNSKVYGRSLLEESYNNYLLGLDEYTKVFGLFKSSNQDKKLGNNLSLTIDHELQKLGHELLGNRNGAVVAMNPKTGEILALVSKPDFDTNEEVLAKGWKAMVESQEAPFLARATQGLYTPGSTFKVVTAAAIIENGLDEERFNDKGVITIDGKEISNSGRKAYGEIDLKKALAVSSNVIFAQLGVTLGQEKLEDIFRRVGFGTDITFDIPVSKSLFQYEKMEPNDMAAVAIGQGKILVSPLHLAMITSGIANNGVIMKPYLVSNITSPTGKEIKSFKREEFKQIMEPDIAAKLKNMMQEVVDSGTGKKAAIKGIKVAGKTGTAENELTAQKKDKAHAWFIGFAPVENPQIAVVVVLEYSGSSGGTIAAPIAQKIMDNYLKDK
ncbi:MAG: peptidoglycan glycosyltransferase [Clostridiaceae bacterium]|jgi:peptidoglycan glycosyltransferase|nr:peptidoglycan glycosyltransferase [Clostridiaceae bacterium]